MLSSPAFFVALSMSLTSCIMSRLNFMRYMRGIAALARKVTSLPSIVIVLVIFFALHYAAELLGCQT